MNVLLVMTGCWLGLGWLMLTAILSEWHRLFNHYRSRRSPLLCCYFFLILASLAFLVYELLNILNGQPYVLLPVFLLGLVFLFSAYTLVLFTWATILLKLYFIYEKWRVCSYFALILFNAVTYGIAMGFTVSGQTIAAASGLMVALFLIGIAFAGTAVTVKYVLKAAVSQREQLQKVTKMANGTCFILLLGLTFFTCYMEFLVYSPNDTLITLLFLQLHQLATMATILFLAFHLRKFAQNQDDAIRLNNSISVHSSSAYASSSSSSSSSSVISI